MFKLAECRGLLAIALAASLMFLGCAPLRLHKAAKEDTAKPDEQKVEKKSKWNWIDKLRDDRALEVERHLGS